MSIQKAGPELRLRRAVFVFDISRTGLASGMLGTPHLVLNGTPERGEKTGRFSSTGARTFGDFLQSFRVSISHAWDGATVIGSDVAAQIYAWEVAAEVWSGFNASSACEAFNGSRREGSLRQQ